MAKSTSNKTTEEAPAGILKLHDLRPARGANKAKIRVGRGEGSKGKTAGRGTKGTKARRSVPVGFEGGAKPILGIPGGLGGRRKADSRASSSAARIQESVPRGIPGG